jgi:hypothetical protein
MWRRSVPCPHESETAPGLTSTALFLGQNRARHLTAIVRRAILV